MKSLPPESCPELPSVEPGDSKELTAGSMFGWHNVFFLLWDIAAWLTLWVFGTSFVPFLLCAVLLGAVQAQAGSCSTTLGTHLQHPYMGLSGHHPIRPREEGPCQLVEPHAPPAPCQA